MLLYLEPEDVRTILRWLDSEQAVAWIVSSEGRCRAQRELGPIDVAQDQKLRLWHVESGLIPLCGVAMPEGDPRVTPEWGIWEPVDPWSGWESSQDSDSLLNHHAFYSWTVRSRRGDVVEMSSMQWIGNHFDRAKPATRKWWGRLGRWVKKNATRIPRSGPLGGPHPEVWAFPSAYAQIAAGAPRSANPL